MNPYKIPSVFKRSLLILVCVLAGATASFAQNTVDVDTDQVQQEIERLQKLLELQQQLRQLQQQVQGQQPQVQQPQPQPQQQVQSQVVPQNYYAPQTQQSVTLRPMDTGRNAVTFSIGGGGVDRSAGAGRRDSGRKYSSDGITDRFAIKTNLLYAGATLTPNLGFEFGLGRRTSLELSAGYNGWTNLWDYSNAGPDSDLRNHYKRRLDHIFGKIEFRYWFRDRFNGHFVGANVLYSDYNVGELKVPLLFDKEYDYNGYAYGGALSYGYLWRLSRHLAMEFTVGAGVVVLEYDKSFIEADETGYNLIDPVPYRKTYFGPTSAGIKLVFTIK